MLIQNEFTEEMVRRLEDNLLTYVPTRHFQDFEVTLPETANTPFDVVHTLPGAPYGVRYEILQSPFPVLIWHDTNDEWNAGYVRLRSTATGGIIRLRLTVDEGVNTLIPKPQAPVFSYGGAILGSYIGPGSREEYDWPSTTVTADSAPEVVKVTRPLVPNTDAALDLGTRGDADIERRFRAGYFSSNVIAGTLVSESEVFEHGRTVAMGDGVNYTPTWTATVANPTLGNGTITGRYSRIGSLVIVNIVLTVGSTTTFGTGDWRFAVPVAADFAVTQGVGTARALDASAGTRYPSNALLADANTIAVTNAAQFNATSPFTWATGDELRLSLTYET